MVVPKMWFHPLLNNGSCGVSSSGKGFCFTRDSSEFIMIKGLDHNMGIKSGLVL